MSRGHRGVIVLGITLALSICPFQSVAAGTGPYTLPFYDPAFGHNQPYGCTSATAEASWVGTNADGTRFDCAHFHNGVDYGLSHVGVDLVVASRAGTVVALVESNADHTIGCGANPGNYVLLDHGGGQYSVYYHLHQNGVFVSQGPQISAGQTLATSGNSGYSCGAHLHYQLTNSAASFANAHSFNPEGKWTTASGLVPFLAAYSSENDAGTVDICYGDIVTHWVRFTNRGGRTWSTGNDAYGRGRIILWSTDSKGTTPVASQFQAPDWEASNRVGGSDQASVAPGGTGTFTFGLRGNGTQGSTYTTYFNVNANGLHWFDYRAIGSYYIPIFIVPHQACG